jgi:Cd2+/Zn2+-exporting ATPase
MIGRYAKLGVYQELFRLKNFYYAFAAAILALLSFFVDCGRPAPSLWGNALALVSIAVNGAPHYLGRRHGAAETGGQRGRTGQPGHHRQPDPGGVSDRRRGQLRHDPGRTVGIQETAILSGDHDQAVQRVADRVGIGRVYGRLKPQDKVAVIKEYQAKGLPVMFVGDGINDGPTLAISNVGVAMGAAGTDVALETADIALTHDKIAKLPWLIRLSRHMLGIIKINIAFGLVFNALAVVAGGMGWLTPVMAAVVHSVGSVIVVFASASRAIFPESVEP